MTAKELTNILQDMCHAGFSMEPVYIEIDGKRTQVKHTITDENGFGPYVVITGEKR